MIPARGGRVIGRAATAGNLDISFDVHNGSDQSGSLKGKLEILPEIKEATPSQIIQTVRSGDRPISIAIPYRGLVEPVKISRTSPLGVTLAGCGLAVESVKVGVYTIEIMLHDAIGVTANTKFVLRVLPIVQQLEVLVDEPVDLIADRDISWRIPVRGGEQEPVVSLVGEIPGLRISNGVLKGRIPSPGEWNVTVRAIDAFSKKQVEKRIKVRATPLVFLRTSPGSE